MKKIKDIGPKLGIVGTVLSVSMVIYASFCLHWGFGVFMLGIALITAGFIGDNNG